jgi:hypothetical protein
MTVVRREYLSLPELFCLKYYRVESGGWRTDTHCRTCITKFQTKIHQFLPSRCLRTSECRCTVCIRQPPSLLGSASQTLFNIIHDLGRFTLVRETTYASMSWQSVQKGHPFNSFYLLTFPTFVSFSSVRSSLTNCTSTVRVLKEHGKL